MSPVVQTIIQIVGALTSTFATFAGGYAAALALAGRKNKISSDRLTSFGLLAPLVWLGLTALASMAGIYWHLLPHSPISVLYTAIACAIPASLLSHSVIEDTDQPTKPHPKPKHKKF